MNFIFSGTGTAPAKVSRPWNIPITEWVDWCTSTFNCGHDIIPLNEIALDECGGHRRFTVEFVNDIVVLVVAGLLTHVYFARTLAYHWIIQLILESHSVALDSLGSSSLS